LLGFLFEVIVVTAMILFLGEIVPKVYSTQNPKSFARFMARPLIILMRLFYPVSSLLVRSTDFIDRRIGNKSPLLTMDDLSEAVDIASGESTTDDEKKILKGIVKFSDLEVKEIMKSRMDVTAIDIRASYKEVISTILESGFSRIPVFSDSFDNIEGILYIKDLLPYLSEDDSFKWQDLIRQAYFIPENKRINDLLQEFQEKKIHLAIVVDEYGGTSGIVTMEDILEEIVGEISDEFDTESDELPYKKIDDHTYVFDGKISLNDLCKIYNIDDRIFEEVKGDADSLAGLILEILGKLPSKGELISFRRFSFYIENADKRRIISVKVTWNENADI